MNASRKAQGDYAMKNLSLETPGAVSCYYFEMKLEAPNLKTQSPFIGVAY